MNKYTKKSSIGGLVLARKTGERVVINRGELLIEVVEIKKAIVRLAFVASKEIIIQRGEVSTEFVNKPCKSAKLLPK
jgi:carbon storage regulator CsrA